MLLSYLMLAVALCLSAVAAYYSIAGLAAIFAAAVIPIVIMGSILEAAKLVVTVWLHEYWDRCRWAMKLYLVPAVFFLMVITSMGIFGFLSKAHSDQSLVSGDVQSKIAVYDEKIKTARENIEANRKQLRQMDEAVDQVMARSTDEKGADKSNAIRRSQQRDRAQLAKDIEINQKLIASLNDESAPIRAEIRKVEAEVGPIKYIAALVYGDNPDANLLERAVRWVIIILVVVFDPLAVMMLLAFTESRKWEKEIPQQAPEPEEVENASELDDNDAVDAKDMDEQPDRDDLSLQSLAQTVAIPASHWGGQDLTHHIQRVEQTPQEPEQIIDEESEAEKQARREWKENNPDDTIHRQEMLLEQGKISQLPWQNTIDQLLSAQADDNENFTNVDFGTKFPNDPAKGDAYIRVDYLPTKLFKWNGIKWIEVDKNITDTFAYNDSYIDHLIAKIGSGEYDPELLNPSEREQIEQRLRNDNNLTGNQ